MRPEFKYGLITGIGLCLWIFAEYWLGSHLRRMGIAQSSGYFSYVIPAIALFILFREQQSVVPQKPLTLRHGAAAGFFVSLVAAMIVYTFLVAYHRWINPFGIDDVLTEKVTEMRAAGIDEMAIRRKITFYRQANGPIGLLLTTFGSLALFCTILSALFTLILRSKPANRSPSVFH